MSSITFIPSPKTFLVTCSTFSIASCIIGSFLALFSAIIYGAKTFEELVAISFN